MGEHLLVVLECCQESPNRQVDPPRLVTRKLLIPEVNLMDDLGELREATVPQAEAPEERLEGLSPGEIESMLKKLKAERKAPPRKPRRGK